MISPYKHKVISFSILAKKFMPGTVLIKTGQIMNQLILIKRGQVGVRKIISKSPLL